MTEFYVKINSKTDKELLTCYSLNASFCAQLFVLLEQEKLFKDMSIKKHELKLENITTGQNYTLSMQRVFFDGFFKNPEYSRDFIVHKYGVLESSPEGTEAVFYPTYMKKGRFFTGQLLINSKGDFCLESILNKGFKTVKFLKKEQ